MFKRKANPRNVELGVELFDIFIHLWYMNKMKSSIKINSDIKK